MLALIYVDLGFNTSATITISEYIAQKDSDRARRTFWSLVTLKLLIGTACAVGIFLFSDWLVINFFSFPKGRLLLRFFGLFVFVSSVSGIIPATLEAHKEYLIRGLYSLGIGIIIYVGVSWGTQKSPYFAPIFFYTIATSVMFLTGLLYLIKKKKFNYPERGADFLGPLKKCWQQGKWIALAAAGMSTVYYMDTLMLTGLSNLESVALYNIALPVMQIYQSLMIFPVVLTPIAVELWQSGKADELQILMKKINLLSFVGLTCGSAIIFLTPFNSMMIDILFSPEFTSASTALNILCLGMLVLVVGQLYASALMVIGKAKKVAIINMVAAFLNIGANFILIPKLDIIGAATATALSYLFLTLGCVWLFQKNTREIST
jgi:O-antigen/teichoic acid export membrane protein